MQVANDQAIAASTSSQGATAFSSPNAPLAAAIESLNSAVFYSTQSVESAFDTAETLAVQPFYSTESVASASATDISSTTAAPSQSVVSASAATTSEPTLNLQLAHLLQPRIAPTLGLPSRHPPS